jgi:hypothetical protein
MPTLYYRKGGEYHIAVTDKASGVRVRGGNGIAQELEGQFLADRMKLSEGLWLMKIAPGCKSLGLVTKVADIPEHPYDFTAIVSKRDELADFMVKFKQEYAKKNPHPFKDKGYMHCPSESEMAQAILEFLANLSGVGKFGKKEEEPRRLDPDL